MMRPTCAMLALSIFACDAAEAPCPQGQRLSNGECIEPIEIRTSGVGFRPERKKRASYVGSAREFTVRRADDGEVVFEGEASDEIAAADSGELVRVADFSELSEPGEYYVSVPGVGKSARFEIADDVFMETFHGTMAGLYGLRCGTAVRFEWRGQTFQHGECHMTDDPGFGGWHDAGDYGKYTNNGAFSLAMVLFAWEHFGERIAGIELDIPERGGDLPDFLDEAKYQVDWLLEMQNDEGGVADRLTPPNFDALNAMPEGTSSARNLAPVSTVGTADFIAVVARAARVFEPYDADYAQRCRDAAVKAWNFVEAQDEILPPAQAGFTGSYQSSPQDDLMWAAAELWETTGEEVYLDRFEETSQDFVVRTNFDWPELQNLGFYTYLDSKRDGRDPARVEEIQTDVKNAGEQMVKSAEEHAYGRSLRETYYWGINGVVARTAMGLYEAYLLTSDERYLDALSFQVDHLLGRNFYGRSFLTGVGFDPPQSPHHRPSIADGVNPPWPGLLVGGPSQSDEPAPATRWMDDSNDYESNEVAINWNAAMIYAVAALLPAQAATQLR